MDLVLFTAAGIGWAFWVLLTLIVLALVGALAYLRSPSPVLYRIAQAAILVDLVETTIATVIAVCNPEVAKQAFLASRTSRGLPVRDGLLHVMTNPASHLLPLVFTVVMGAVWLFLLHKLERGRAQRLLRGELTRQ